MFSRNLRVRGILRGIALELNGSHIGFEESDLLIGGQEIRIALRARRIVTIIHLRE